MCTFRIALFLALLSRAHAQLSIYIPDTDPQPLSAIELGVGEDGRTTWEILPGQPTGTWVGQADGFPTLTLAEDAQAAVLTGAPDLSFAVSCTLLPTTPGQTAPPLAACTNLAGGGAGWEEAADPILVQTGAASSTPGAGGGGGGTGGGSGLGTGAGTGAGTGGGAGPTTRPVSPNGSVSGSPIVPSTTVRPQSSSARREGSFLFGTSWAVWLGAGVGLGWWVGQGMGLLGL